MERYVQRLEFSGKAARLKIFQLLSVICIALPPPISVPALASSREPADDPGFLVRAKDNLLTVKLRDVPLEEVLTEIANQTGIQITFYGQAGKNLSADFSDIPLDKGLSRLTRGSDHIFIYRGEGAKGSGPEIREVIIRCKAGGRPLVIGPQEQPTRGAGKPGHDSLAEGLRIKDRSFPGESAHRPMEMENMRATVHLIGALLDDEEGSPGENPHGTLGDLANRESPSPATGVLSHEGDDVAESALGALAQIEAKDDTVSSVDAPGHEHGDRGLVMADLMGNALSYLREGLSVLITACRTIREGDLADLQSTNEAVKREALRKFSRKESFVTNLAGRFLNRNIEKKAVTTMLALLGDGRESEDIQLNILTAMGELGKKTEVSVSPLIDKVKSGDPRMRLQAVESLGKIKDKKAVPALIQLLETEANRYPVIWALGEIGDKSAVPALNRLLTSEDKYVRYNANKALAKIR
jgi:hypothetical protein